MCKQNSSDSFKNEINYKLFPYKLYMYIRLNVYKQMTDVKLLFLHSNTWNHLTLCKQMINNRQNYSWNNLSVCKKNYLRLI